MSVPDAAAREEISAVRITADSLAAGTGHIGTVLLSVVTAILMPRLMGVTNFGNWVLFRTIILLATTFTYLGSQHIMSRIYAPLVRTDPMAAGRLFKSVACGRVVLGTLAALAGYGLLRHLGGAIFSRTDGWILALTIVFRALAATPIVLLYGHARIRPVALLHFLVSAVIPLWVLGGYMIGGFPLLPAACAVGEGLIMLIAWRLAWQHVRWPPGWPDRARLRQVARFAGHVAPASFGTAAFSDAAVCLAATVGATTSQLAFVGLAIRLQGVVLSGLMAMNRAILPSLSVMADHGRLARGTTWIGLLCRTGGVLILGVAGAMAFVGRPVIGLVWGDAYVPALLPICLGFVAALPLWIAATQANLALMIQRTDLQLRSVIWLYGGVAATFFALPLFPVPERLLTAITVGGVCSMASLVLVLRRVGSAFERLDRLTLLAVIAVVPVTLVHYATERPWLLLPWLAVFGGVVLLSRSLQVQELKRIAGHIVSALCGASRR